MRGLCVLIMAAGKGTRMKSAVPKVLQPILDRPIIDYVINNSMSAGVNQEDICVLVGSGGELVEEHLQKTFPAVKILWQHEQLGTGHAVKTALEWWQNYENLIVLNGDVPLIKPESLENLISSSSENDCTVITFIAKNPGAYGRILRFNPSVDNSTSPLKSGDNAVPLEGRETACGGRVAIIEFKDADEEIRKIHEVNAGCYAFKVSSLKEIINLINNDNAQKEYYLTDALALMNENNFNTDAFILPEEETQGINTQAELAKATKVMRKRILHHWLNEGVRILAPESVYISPDSELSQDVVIMPNVQIWGKSKISKGVYIGSGSILKNAVIHENVNVIAYAYIENSELKENSKAGPFCYIRENSCLEKNSFAGKFVELKNSRIGENSKVPHLSYFGDATLGHDVNIGAGSITCNYDGKNKNKTLIGDNCFVGSDTMFVAPVEVGDNASTAAGSVITQKVPENSLGVGRARQTNIADWSLRRKHFQENQSTKTTNKPEGEN